jgi:putative transposase
MTDAEWSVIEPLLPTQDFGRRWRWPMREIVNGLNYVLRGGISWALIPKDFPPKSTLYRWFCRFRDEALFEKINFALVGSCPDAWCNSAQFLGRGFGLIKRPRRAA